MVGAAGDAPAVAHKPYLAVMEAEDGDTGGEAFFRMVAKALNADAVAVVVGADFFCDKRAKAFKVRLGWKAADKLTD